MNKPPQPDLNHMWILTLSDSHEPFGHHFPELGLLPDETF
jgi:hypothetical protein